MNSMRIIIALLLVALFPARTARISDQALICRYALNYVAKLTREPVNPMIVCR